jgi:hypothetical protein
MASRGCSSDGPKQFDQVKGEKGWLPLLTFNYLRSQCRAINEDRRRLRETNPIRAARRSWNPFFAYLRRMRWHWSKYGLDFPESRQNAFREAPDMGAFCISPTCATAVFHRELDLVS